MQISSCAGIETGGAARLSPFLHRREEEALTALIYLDLKDKWQPVGESNPSFQVENLAS